MPQTHQEYLLEVERLAKVVVHEICEEGKFEPFSGERAVTRVEVALVELARTLRYRHSHDDGCVDDE